ncbi:porphobilinogen deaminase [Clostridium homopropionicum DSM 5847]|uniref:Porphobilinogen deaminase n=1 Tax=Clostridium homopropionicum DSM 5847 TaxID=1121318 RepID=A0A0L6ZCK7_9CLOT|nr:hydroxymethylbilane synthase [Clostridium homopropionicum]KOA20696.1 porphobilinogen deaminase [Clostridium homopropionicum DSM 5847]SFF91262.1 hydroxymethylbilane synthase [Clostridium homopropionicum]
MIKNKIKIGTRGSKLALIQTNLVINALKQQYTEIECEVVVIHTTGDKILDKPLIEFGGKAVFVSEFEEALLKNDIDLAIHSAKDMPMKMKEGLDILGVLKREDPRDVLITMRDNRVEEKSMAVIGTSSLRRQMQVEELYTNIECKPLRGNVNTRVNKLKDGMYDGIILAAAGINRLELNMESDCEYKYFDIDELIPAGGQGIIAIEGRKNSELSEVIGKISDSAARLELETERRILELFNAGCHEPIGAYSKVDGNEITIWMMKEVNGEIIKTKESTSVEKRLKLAEKMANSILEEIPHE